MTSRKTQWLAVFGVLVLFALLLVFWGRCTYVNHEALLAKVRVENQTASAWRIQFSMTSGGGRTLEVAAWDTLEVPLLEGDYRITQTLLDEHGAEAAVRVFDLGMKRGKVYQWPLVTLLAPDSLDAEVRR